MSDSPQDNTYTINDAPSIGADPNANPHAFKVRGDTFYQTITPSGVVTKDQVFATKTTDDVIPPEAVEQYSAYLILSNKVKPISNLTPEEFSINQQYIEEAVKRRNKALDLIGGTEYTEENLNVIAKQKPLATSVPDFQVDASSNTAPSVVSKDFAHLPADAGVYSYQQIDLYDDRYDFETGKKIRVGVAGGIAGGAGNTTTEGNTESTVEQSEYPNYGPPM
ncbi:MAG: hypothetical protein CMG35_04950 [Candidatus Marinimicrobia bacterium]|nr:hypothetical protein [Candidatus Neomarinimicrobiota bacterium]